MKTQADAKNLFQVRLLKKALNAVNGAKSPDEEMEVVTTQQGLGYYHLSSARYSVLDVQSLGALWPEGCTVECTGSDNPFRSYIEASYKIRSPKPLTEKDLQTLRAQGCFMRGQVTGACDLEKFERDGDLYVYSARSVCDSGD